MNKKFIIILSLVLIICLPIAISAATKYKKLNITKYVYNTKGRLKIKDLLTVTKNAVFKGDIKVKGDINVENASLIDGVDVSDLKLTVDDLSVGQVSLDISDGSGLTLSGNTLALLSTCSDDQILKFNADSSSWECAEDNAAISGSDMVIGDGLNLDESNVLSVSGITSDMINNNTIQADDLASNSCASGQMLKFNGASWACAEDIDTDTDTDTVYTAGSNVAISAENVISATDTNTTYTAGTGLTLNGTEFTSNLGTGIDSGELETGAIVSGDVEVADLPTLSSDNLSDVASISMLDENETVTGSWNFPQVNMTNLLINNEARRLSALQQIPKANTTTAVDSTGSVGEYSSITIGTDGYPVISYYDTTNTNLKVAKCSDVACSSSTQTAVDSTGDVGQYSSITIGTDGYPVISYYDTTNTNLKVAKCANAACSSGTTLTTVDNTDSVGRYTSITISTDGYPVISYFDGTNSDLKVAKCANAACSSSTTLTTVDSTGDVGRTSSITIGTDGYPIISYYDNSDDNLEVAKCTNAACSSRTFSTLDSTDDVGYYTSIAIGPDGLPVISYYDTTNGDLKVAKCAYISCLIGTTTTTIDDTGTVGTDTSITIGTDGYPVVSYYDSTNSALKVAKCANAACSSSTTLITVDSTGDVGTDTSITIGTDGYPVISYFDGTNSNLKVIKAANPFFVNYWTRR